MNSFFAFVFRQKYITRWALMRNISPESLSEHSAEVAVLAHALALIGNRIYGKDYQPDRIASAALFHDVPEVITGDLPTPIKYFSPALKSDYKLIEDNAIETLLDRLPPELRADYSALLRASDLDAPSRLLIKAADKLAAYIKCLEEEKGGNTEFRSAAASTLNALEQFDCPELQYFLTELLPAFRMTLDEIS